MNETRLNKTFIIFLKRGNKTCVAKFLLCLSDLFIYKLAQPRDITAMTIEKMEWHEIVSDFIKMLQSLPEKEMKMALGAVAGHYDLGVVSNKLASRGLGIIGTVDVIKEY